MTPGLLSRRLVIPGRASGHCFQRVMSIIPSRLLSAISGRASTSSADEQYR